MNFTTVQTHEILISYSHRIGGNQKRNTIGKPRSKVARNRVIDRHLSPDWRQLKILFLAIVKSVTAYQVCYCTAEKLMRILAKQSHTQSMDADGDSDQILDI